MSGFAQTARSNSEVIVHRKPAPLASDAVTHDWRSFLGPSHNAMSSETRLRIPWPEEGPPLVWEMRKGSGYSAPAIAGERLVFFHRLGDEEIVECLHAEDGRRFWQYRYPTQYEDRYGYNNGPRASPIIDQEQVYVFGAEGKLHCLELKTGRLVWRLDTRAHYRVPQDFFGVASTPLIEGDLLIVTVGAPGGPTVVGLDKRTGKQVWGAGKEWGPSYASPIPATVHGRRRVFVFAGGESRPPTGGLMVIDPATGAVDFSFPWRSRSYESVNASSPVIVANQVFISASYRTGSALLNLLPNGGYTPAWTTQEFGLHWMTPIVKDGFIYGFDGRNEPDASLACLELKTGKLMWRITPEWEETFFAGGAPRTQRMSTYRGSLLWADGKFLCLGELGHLLAFELTPKGARELARSWLFAARETWALPVLSRGLLYVTQNSRDVINATGPRLLCYDLRASRGRPTPG